MTDFRDADQSLQRLLQSQETKSDTITQSHSTLQYTEVTGYSMHVAPVSLVDEPSWLQGDGGVGDTHPPQLVCGHKYCHRHVYRDGRRYLRGFGGVVIVRKVEMK